MTRFYIYSLFLFLTVSLSAVLYTNEVITIDSASVQEAQDKGLRTATVNNGVLTSDYDGKAVERKIESDLKNFPQFTTGYPIIDYLYLMALEETLLNINEQGFFVAGEKWNQAWTRDMSYAIYLGLSHVFTETSLKSLTTRVSDGVILQDTGTGGSYPVSTDRMTWVIAAYETALASGRKEVLQDVYDISSKSMKRDLELNYSSDKKMFKGEQSFLDWREQTYPQWMSPQDIGESYALGTNIVYFLALQSISKMAKQLGDQQTEWENIANDLKYGINKQLYSEKYGHWGSYLIGGVYPVLYEGYETLGISLGLLAGLSTDGGMLHSLQTQAYGHPVVAPQLKNIRPYHNNSVWPFVQSYRAIAAAETGELSVFTDEFFTLIRSAALFQTFKENLVASTGDKNGTQVNSDRQLWSVAGYLGMVYKGIFGMRFSNEGLTFKPVKPLTMKKDISLSNFKYGDAKISVRLQGVGTKIESVTVNNEKKSQDYMIPYSSSGNFDIIIVLKDVGVKTEYPKYYNSKDSIKVVETISVSDLGNERFLKWGGAKNKSYSIYQNGTFLENIVGVEYKIPKVKNSIEYFVVENTENLPALKGAPIWTENKKTIYISEAETAKTNGGEKSTKIMQRNVKATNRAILNNDFNRFSYNGRGYIEKWGGEIDDSMEFNLKVPESGTYLLRFRFMNGGPINTGEKCAIKELSVNDDFIDFAYFPHTGNWREWKFSSPIEISLKKGKNNIRIYNSSKTYSQKNVLPTISVDLIRVDYLK